MGGKQTSKKKLNKGKKSQNFYGQHHEWEKILLILEDCNKSIPILNHIFCFLLLHERLK